MARLVRAFAGLFLGLALLQAPLALAQEPSADVQPASARPSTTDDYRLGSGDKIRIIVYDEEALSGQFVVSGAGKIAMPLIGEVQAANMTVPEFQAELVKAFSAGYLKDPRVSVEVLNYRPYYILGEVNKPGEYPYSNGLNVLNAVATAGGFTYRAQTKRVFIRRHSDEGEKSYPISSDTLVEPGDTIRVTERFF